MSVLQPSIKQEHMQVPISKPEPITIDNQNFRFPFTVKVKYGRETAGWKYRVSTYTATNHCFDPTINSLFESISSLLTVSSSAIMSSQVTSRPLATPESFKRNNDVPRATPVPAPYRDGCRHRHVVRPIPTHPLQGVHPIPSVFGYIVPVESVALQRNSELHQVSHGFSSDKVSALTTGAVFRSNGRTVEIPVQRDVEDARFPGNDAILRDSLFVERIRDSANPMVAEPTATKDVRSKVFTKTRVPSNANDPYFLTSINLNRTSNMMLRDRHQARAEEILKEQSMGRSRTRSIAIKRTPQQARKREEPDDISEGSNMYDWATWRMYNRIVDHRRKNSVRSYNYYDDSTEASTKTQQSYPHFRAMSTMVNAADYEHSFPLDQPEYLLEGEVFDLDL
jgi:hypothetical protein